MRIVCGISERQIEQPRADLFAFGLAPTPELVVAREQWPDERPVQIRDYRSRSVGKRVLPVNEHAAPKVDALRNAKLAGR